jgi:hypothetical protein
MADSTSVVLEKKMANTEYQIHGDTDSNAD